MYSKLEIKKDAIVVETGDVEFHPSTANINGRCYFRDLPEHLKPKPEPPLFITDDGVGVSEGKMWLLSTLGWQITDVFICSHPFRGVTGNEFKYFSTKSAAEIYKQMNKPCLSVKDVIELCEQVQFHNRIHDRADEDYYAVYVSLLKTRLRELSNCKSGSADR
jgi:hypothetical protein